LEVLILRGLSELGVWIRVIVEGLSCCR